MNLLWSDYDNDSDKDFFTAIDDESDYSKMYRNDRASGFVDVTFDLGSEQFHLLVMLLAGVIIITMGGLIYMLHITVSMSTIIYMKIMVTVHSKM